MSLRRPFIRLRQQLVILAFVSVLPALAVTLYDALDDRRRRHDEVSAEAERIARAAVARQEVFLEATHSRLAGLSAAQQVIAGDPAACSRFLGDYADRWPGSHALGLFEPDGSLRCAGTPGGDATTRTMPESARRFARRVAAEGRFTAGRYFAHPDTRRAFVVAGFPVTDGDGRTTGVLTVSREVRWLGNFLVESVMPTGAVLFLVSSTGEVLARVPEDADTLPVATVSADLLDSLAARGTGTVETTSIDGQVRLHGFAPFSGVAGDGGPFVVVGLSNEHIYAAANAALRASLLRLVVITLVVLAVAAAVGEVLVLRRVRALTDVTGRVADGDLDASFTRLSREGELGEIAGGLERMTRALRERERETREALLLLRRSEERYRALVHGTSQMVWTADADGRLVDDQPSWREVTGQTWEEIRGHGWLEAVHPDDRGAIAAAWRLASRERRPYVAEYRVRAADGSWRPYASHGCPLLEADGRTVREWVGFCMDLTEKHAAEEALRMAEEAHRQGQKLEAIGRLAGGVAHDFNNLLTAVTSYAQLLLEDAALGDQHRADVQEIRRAADRGTALVRQLLAFGRRQPVRAAVLDVGEIVAGMEEMLRRLLGASYVLDVRLDPEAGPVRADGGQLEQVVLNLVLNARDAMPAGGRITIETGSTACAPGECVASPACTWLRVRDHGMGMDESVRERVFEPFFTTKEPGKGTGLGLATVYGTVKQAGGLVEVESEPGEGTTFTVRFPQAGDDVARASTYVGSMHESVRHEPVPGSVPPRATGGGRVLVADDEATVRHALGRALRRAGFAVLEAADGHAALEAAGAGAASVDLVLSDVMMPRLNGVELAARLRQVRPGLPIVLVSGFASELARRAERELPDVPLVDKPFDVARLTTLVGDMIAAAGSADAVETGVAGLAVRNAG